MRRATSILIVLAVIAAGCGDSGPEEATDPLACPAGTEPLTVREALGTVPRGYRLVRRNRRALNAYAEQFHESVGDEKWRGHEARVLVRRGRREGVGMIVINTSERRLERVVAELEGRENGGETLQVAGREGWIQQAPGGWLAVAPTGECSLLLLTSADDALLRDAASHVGAGG
jgi:hypothetical protein